MKRAEFDKFAQEYRQMHETVLRISGERPEYFADYKARDLRRLLRQARTAGRRLRILDFGAGVGTSVSHIARHVPDSEITCADLSLDSLSIGQRRHGSKAEFVAFNGQALPFRDASFDAALAACAFHHIPAPDHVRLLTELRRVLKPNGTLMVYEHNPLNPLTRSAVDACPFDENAALIRSSLMRAALSRSGFNAPRVRFRIFFPRQLSALRPLERLLTWLPIGAQYYVAAEK